MLRTIFFAIIYFVSHGIFSSMLMSSVSKLSKVKEVHQHLVEFPDDFLFGAASSAYQIEGGWNEDGKSESVWDKLTHEHPEIIADRSNGDVSVDSYHLFMKDVKALKSVGFHFYRFSVSWPRVITNGTIINLKGIDYYNKLIDALIANDIQPVITIFHWDLPAWLQNLGGFTNPLIVKYFEFYANVLFDNFGDRVKMWITFNEPLLFCLTGYGKGTSGPFIQAQGTGEYLCGHHALLSHATVYHLYKRKFFKHQKGEVGIVMNFRQYYPKDASVSSKYVKQALEFTNGWLINPIFSKSGGYPQIMVERFENISKIEKTWSRLPVMSEEDKKFIKGTADFLGVNYYTSRLISPKNESNLPPYLDNDIDVDFSTDPSWSKGDADWFYIVPEGLYDILIWLRDNYNNPKIFITENGFPDDGRLIDNGRINYIQEHLTMISKAMRQKCNIKGYTVWSLLDSFEWIDGYTLKFGIFSVDKKKERIAKKSVMFLKELIKRRKFQLESNKI